MVARKTAGERGSGGGDFDLTGTRNDQSLKSQLALISQEQAMTVTDISEDVITITITITATLAMYKRS